MERQNNIDEEATGQYSVETPNSRDQRIYLRVSQHEKDTLRSLAQEAGFNSLAQYVRQRALHSSEPFERSGEHLVWLGTVNRIANYLDEVGSQLRRGRPVDEDLLLHVMQIADLAEETLNEVRRYNDRATVRAC